MKENFEKITPDLLARHPLLFLPRTADEAIFIQEKLFGMGLDWNGRRDKKIGHVAEVLVNGIAVYKGNLYYIPGTGINYLLARAEQFDGAYLPPEHKFLREQFALVHARLDAMDAKIEALQDALLPKDLGKSAIRKPGP